jgi:hypothetical protein
MFGVAVYSQTHIVFPLAETPSAPEMFVALVASVFTAVQVSAVLPVTAVAV